MKTYLEILNERRHTWLIKPVTKVHGTKKGYDKNDRKQGKEEYKKHIDVKV